MPKDCNPSDYDGRILQLGAGAGVEAAAEVRPQVGIWKLEFHDCLQSSGSLHLGAGGGVEKAAEVRPQVALRGVRKQIPLRRPT